MKELRLIAFAAIATMFVISVGAHPGPERHPIEQEMFDLETDLRAEINDLERRLTSRIDNLDAPDEDAIADAVATALNVALVDITNSSDELKVQVEEVVASNQSLLWGLIAVAAVGAVLILVVFILIFVRTKSPSQATA